jgi:hypothetical protein
LSIVDEDAPGLRSASPTRAHRPGLSWNQSQQTCRTHGCYFEIDAESLSGKVSSEFPTNSTAPPTSIALKGAVGVDPKIKLELRSNDGPIEIRKNPGATATPGAGVG